MNPWCVGDSLVYLSSLELMTQESPSSTRRGGSRLYKIRGKHSYGQTAGTGIKKKVYS